MLKPLPSVPDHPALEREVLERWEEEQTFRRLREQNAGGPRFSFIDGPISANNPMGVHHAWGRPLKDVFQRYYAAKGHDAGYQNGFDCQGLWVGVEVEKELGLNSKREIEDYGIAEFAARCKERVARYVGVMTQQSKRLGQWMDWGNDYLTFSDANIEYIWRFLKECRAREWLFKGHRSTQWCPRCGTSLSQHEQAGEENYRELEHPSLYVRFPLVDRDGESLVVWTKRAPTTTTSSRARTWSGSSTTRRSTTCSPRKASGTASSPGTRSRSTKAPGSSTSRRARAPRTSSSRACTACRCWRRSTSRAASSPATGPSRGSRPTVRRRRSSARSTSAACSSR